VKGLALECVMSQYREIIVINPRMLFRIPTLNESLVAIAGASEQGLG
jgi:hypothetical protein